MTTATNPSLAPVEKPDAEAAPDAEHESRVSVAAPGSAALRLVAPSAALTRRPWLKVFLRAWRGDERLALCSLGARGLWIELVNLMHAAEPRGYLVVNGGLPTDAEITRLVRATSVSEMRRLVQELLTAGIVARAADGVLYWPEYVRAVAQKRSPAKRFAVAEMPRSSKGARR